MCCSSFSCVENPENRMPAKKWYLLISAASHFCLKIWPYLPFFNHFCLFGERGNRISRCFLLHKSTLTGWRHHNLYKSSWGADQADKADLRCVRESLRCSEKQGNQQCVCFCLPKIADIMKSLIKSSVSATSLHSVCSGCLMESNDKVIPHCSASISAALKEVAVWR